MSGLWEDIKNCIFWDNASLDNSLYGYLSYSDVEDDQSFPTFPEKDPMHNFYADPRFDDTTEKLYDLQDESPCKNTGDYSGNPTEMGAYGGEYGGDDENGWGPGVGAPASGVGADWTP